MTSTVAQAGYKKDDLVMVRRTGGEWQAGVVKDDTSGRFTRVATKDSPSSCSTLVPGYEEHDIRPATFADLYQQPDFVRHWIVTTIRESMSPKIPPTLIRGAAADALKFWGIKTYADVQQRSDVDLLVCEGVGGGTVKKLRAWQKTVEELLPVHRVKYEALLDFCRSEAKWAPLVEASRKINDPEAEFSLICAFANRMLGDPKDFSPV